ncbi:hypothetical protein QTP88_019976 [Uroleucon formosanum]
MGDHVAQGIGRNMVGNHESVGLTMAKFKSELLEKFNGDELQSSLQSELLSTTQTKTERLGEYVLHKYQLYWRLNLGLTEEAVVMTVIGFVRDEFRIHSRIQLLKAFSELRALTHVLDGNKAVMSDKAETAEKSQVPNPKQRLFSGAGYRVCGSHDHWQAAYPKKSRSRERQNDRRDRRVPAGQEVTGGKTASRPKRAKQQISTRAVSNVPVQEPQITKTDPKERNFKALRTGESGKSPKNTDKTIPEFTGSEPKLLPALAKLFKKCIVAICFDNFEIFSVLCKPILKVDKGEEVNCSVRGNGMLRNRYVWANDVHERPSISVTSKLMALGLPTSRLLSVSKNKQIVITGHWLFIIRKPDNPPQLTISNVRHINSNDSTEFNFDTDASPMSTDNAAIDNNSIVDMQLNTNDNKQTTSDGHGNDSSGNAIVNNPIIDDNLLSFSDSYLGPLYIIIDAIDKNLHPGKLHPMKIGKLIHGKVAGVTEIKSLGARVRLTFDNVTNANNCLSENPLKSHGYTATIPSTLVSPSIRSPVQCSNCLRFGHTGRFCRSKPRCSPCSETNHNLLSCTTATITDPTCFYCKGSHIASDRSCPEWIRQKKIKKIMAGSSSVPRLPIAITSSSAPNGTFLAYVESQKNGVSRDFPESSATAPLLSDVAKALSSLIANVISNNQELISPDTLSNLIESLISYAIQS